MDLTPPSTEPLDHQQHLAERPGASPLQPAAQPHFSYAGFWKRAAAYLMDYLILFISLGMVEVVVIALLALSPLHNAFFHISTSTTGIWALYGLITLVDGMANILYYAIFEASSKQATPGKMILGVIVVDMQGKRLSFSHALGRELLKTLSVVIGILVLIVGAFLPFALAAWTPKKQALYDLVARTLVIKK